MDRIDGLMTPLNIYIYIYRIFFSCCIQQVRTHDSFEFIYYYLLFIIIFPMLYITSEHRAYGYDRDG
jgi:hypothetical protein